MSNKFNLDSLTLISVIVPCYNHAEFLGEALDSVLSQTYTNWECIIVNDGSNDNTHEISHKYLEKDSRFKYLYKENGGLSSARNAGIKIAEGEFILPVDADDIIGKEYIELAFKAFEKNPSLKLVYCLGNKFGYENNHWDLKNYSYTTLLRANCIFCSAIFKKQNWIDVNGYDEDLIHGWEDWAFWLKILDENSIVYQIPKVLFFYRVKQNSMLLSMTAEQMEQIQWKLFFRHFEAYKKHFPSPQTQISLNERLKALNEKIINSYSYRLGNFLIKPFSFLKNLWFR